MKSSTLSTNKKDTLSCWVISDGRAGTEVQSLALANSLGQFLDFKPILKRVALRFPWSILPEFLWVNPLAAYDQTSDSLKAPWPDIIIGSGRCCSATVAYIRAENAKHQGPKLLTIQIQDPRLNPNKFDVVIVPKHSECQGPNVIETHGSLHALQSGALSEAAQKWAPAFADLPSKKIAVLIGGASKYYKMGAAVSTKLVEQLVGLEQQGYGLLITASRRTPDSFLQDLAQRLNPTTTYIWDGTGPNPYLGLLSLSAAVLVTSDSVSMVTEACSLHKPVYIIPLPVKSMWRPCRLEKFRTLMIDKGYAYSFDGTVDFKAVAKSFHDLDRVTATVLKIWNTLPPQR